MTKDAAPKVILWSPDGRIKGSYPLLDDRVTVGRAVPGHTPDIPLSPDPQAWISRLHCWFERIAGSWYVIDNGSVNGTVIDRKGRRDPVDGRQRLLDRDEVLILGYLVEDEPYWWRLRVEDPFATADAPPVTAGSEGPYIEYRLEEAKLFVVKDGQWTEVVQLGRNRHKLVRYMVSRNAANGGTPVTCTHDELIAAVWGEPETWRFRTAYSPENLRNLVFELRQKLHPYEALLETVPGIGYSLRTRSVGPQSASAT